MNTIKCSMVILCVIFLSTTVMAGDWQVLGEKTVMRINDRDTIHVGKNEGEFRKIKFKVEKSGVHFIDVKVHFLNGRVFDVSLKSFIKAGGASRVIDLPGKDRYIEKVVFWYKTKGKRKGQGLVKLLGKE